MCTLINYLLFVVCFNYERRQPDYVVYSQKESRTLENHSTESVFLRDPEELLLTKIIIPLIT